METEIHLSTMSPVRERIGFWMTQATRVSFGILLFSSGSMWQWRDILRRMPPVYSGYTDFFLYPSDLFLGLTLLFGLLAPLVAGQKLQRGPWYLTFPLAALVLLSFISTFVSVDPPLTLYHSFRVLMLLGLYLVLVNTLLPPVWVAVPLALAVLVQSTVGILQFVNQSSIGLQAWGELILDPATTGVSILRYDSVRILRAYGLTDHPNLLGGFLAFALIFILGYYFSAAHRARYLMLIPFALGVVALFYTFSRAAQVALGAGVAVMLLALWRHALRQRPQWRPVALVTGVVVLALVVPVLNNQRLIAQRVGQGNAFSENVGEQRSLVERDVLIESANRVFYQRELLGVGNGALPLGMFYLDKEFPGDQYDYQPAHMVLLVAAAELGLFGGFLWGWLMLAPLLVVWMRRAYIIAQPWAAAVAASVVVMLVVGFVDYYPWFWQPGRLWQWSAWGLFAAVFAVQFSRGVNE